MDPRSLTYVAAGCGGRLTRSSPGLLVSRVCTDSRTLAAGDLFFALAGERFDGHEFVPEAARKGAAAVVVETGRAPTNLAACAVIEVDHGRRALLRLAESYRRDFELPIIAVAGSNGKTTTKELLAAVLRQRFHTLASPASFNNDIGVPLTLLELGRTHQVAVLEVGTNHPGELAPLVGLIRPRYGVLTCLGREHLEFFGDLAGVAQEEGWLAESMPAEGKLFLNGDSPGISAVLARARCAAVRLGQRPDNPWRIARVEVGEAGTTFWVEAPEAPVAGEYRVSLLGRHQALNALFAIALGTELGLTRAEISQGLASCPAVKMRLQVSQVRGVRVLDDAYNANADSMLAALQTARELPCAGRRVAVLGDMAELGSHTQAAHEEIGRRAGELGLDSLFAVGQWAPVLGAAARSAGLQEVCECRTVEAAAAQLRTYVRPGDLVLLKASRATRLERVAEALRREDGS